MRKKLTVLSIYAMLFTAITLSAFAQRKEKENKKEQKINHGKEHVKTEKAGKSTVGKTHSNDQQKGKKEHKGYAEARASKDKEHGNSGNGNDVKHPAKGNKSDNDDYTWDDDTFKDRKKIKNRDKVSICHKFKSDKEPAVAITVSPNALKAHLKHGDITGNCPAIPGNRFSDVFVGKRKDYYNTIESSQEQLTYSRSILDYALVRLTNSRSQLVTLKTNNMPQADIERKQQTVLRLEENVSVLESLIGVAANFLVNKLN